MELFVARQSSFLHGRGPRKRLNRFHSRVGTRAPLSTILYNCRVAKTVPFTDARTHLTELLDEIERIHEHVIITRNGRPAAVVMSPAEYDSLLETLEVLSDTELMAALAESDEDIAAGRVIPWDEVKQELGLA